MNNQSLKENNSLDRETEERGYDAPLSEYVELCKKKNKNLESTKLVGVSVSKEIKESLKFKRKTNLKICQLVEKGDFVIDLMSLEKMKTFAMGLYVAPELVCTSFRYHVFKVINPDLLSKYLMLLLKKGKVNREALYNCFGGVRGELHWKDFIKIKICVPPLKTQEKIVHKYQLLEKMIQLKRKINDLLEKWMQAYYHVLFDNLSEDQYTLKTFGELFDIRGGGAHQDLVRS